MEKKKLSFHMGDVHNQIHNTRADKRHYPENADPSLEHQNEYLINHDIEKLYETLYKDILEKYNEGKKPSRQIHNYYKHLKDGYEKAYAKDKQAGKNKNSKTSMCTSNRDKIKSPVKEIIIQIGNKDNTGIDYASTLDERQIIKDYLDSFETRNFLFKVVSANIHADEPNGTLHMHLAFIPFNPDAYGKSKKKLDGVSSFNQCYKDMKCEPTKEDKEINKFITPFECWQERERKYISELAKQRGIELDLSPNEEKRQHLETAGFKLHQEIQKAEQKIKQVQEKTQQYVQIAEQSAKEQTEKIRRQEQAKQRDIQEQTEQKQAELRQITGEVLSAEQMKEMNPNLKRSKSLFGREKEKKVELTYKQYMDLEKTLETTRKDLQKEKETTTLFISQNQSLRAENNSLKYELKNVRNYKEAFNQLAQVLLIRIPKLKPMVEKIISDNDIPVVFMNSKEVEHGRHEYSRER